MSFLKKALSIDDNYIKNVLILKSPKQTNKFKYKELFSLTPYNLKINNNNNYKEIDIDINEDKILSSFNENLKSKKTKISKTLLFYNTGKFDIPLLSNFS